VLGRSGGKGERGTLGGVCLASCGSAVWVVCGSAAPLTRAPGLPIRPSGPPPSGPIAAHASPNFCQPREGKHQEAIRDTCPRSANHFDPTKKHLRRIGRADGLASPALPLPWPSVRLLTTPKSCSLMACVRDFSFVSPPSSLGILDSVGVEGQGRRQINGWPFAPPPLVWER